MGHYYYLTMDVFQGWFKDGMGGSRDYRAVSSLYLLLRLLLSGSVYLLRLSTKVYGSRQVIGVCHVFVGAFFLMAKPYKKNWMNYVDGLIIDVVGIILLVWAYNRLD